MNPSHKKYGNRGAILAVLLVVMAAASGCGTMPTSPVVAPAGQVSQNQSVGSSSMMDGTGDESNPGGNPVITPDPTPEIQPTPITLGTPGGGHGYAYGKGHIKKH